VAFTHFPPSTQTSTAAGTPSTGGPTIYTVTFSLGSQSLGQWTVNFDGTNYTSTNPQITIPCAAGTHNYTITPPSGYQLFGQNPSGVINVTQNMTIPVNLIRAYTGGGGARTPSAGATQTATPSGQPSGTPSTTSTSGKCAVGFNAGLFTICFDPLINAIVDDFQGVIVQPLEYDLSGLADVIANNVASAIQSALSNLGNLTNAITSTVQTAITNALSNAQGLLTQVYNTIRDSVTNSLNAVKSEVGEVSSALTALAGTFENVLNSTIGGLWNDITSALNGLHDALNAVWNDLKGAVGAIYNYLQTQVMPAFGDLWNDVAGRLSDLSGIVASGLGQLQNTVGSGMSGLTNYIDNGLNDVKSILVSDLSQAWTQITSYVGSIEGETQHLVGNLTQVTVTAFNQLFAGFQSLIVDVDKGLEQFATDVWSGMQLVWNKILSPVLTDVEHAIGDFFNLIGNGLTSLVRDIEGIAKGDIVGKLAGISASIGTSAVAAVAGLTLAENANPASNMRFVESLRTALEISGIAAIPGLVNGLIMNTALAKPLSYYFNYQIQPDHMPPQEAARAVWYGALTQEDYANELRYAGLNENAINAFLATIYRPMPAFFLEKLAELQVVPNDFVLKQLMMEGYPPDQVHDIMVGFQNLELQSFQNNAKSIVYEMYKAGYIDDGKATQILNAFSVPQTQIKWILYMADQEFDFEQKVQVQTMILDGISRGAWTPQQAKQMLVQLGMNADRADTLVKIKSVMAAPELPKSDRAKLMQEALGITLPAR